MKATAVVNLCLPIILAAAFPSWAAAATHQVEVGPGLSFSPNDLTIQVGDTVHWSSDGGTHDVKADDGSFSSGTPSSSINFSRTFNSVGEILYYCSVHSSPGQNINTFMNGRITVQSGGGGTAELAVQSVNAQHGTYAPGDSIAIDTSIQNMGTAASTGYTVRLYASTNLTINSSDTEIGSSNRSALPASQTSNFSVNATIPADLAPGVYFIGAIVDFADGNSANNTNVEQTAITVTASGEFVINNGLNDAWRDINTRGQGFFVTVFPDIQKMFVGWFTYDVERPAQGIEAILGEPGHRWITAFGDYSGDTATLDFELTQGGIFDSGIPAPTSSPYGTLTIHWSSCSEAVATYDIPSVPISGTVDITRAANDNLAGCGAFATP
jgi:plastocyanin